MAGRVGGAGGGTAQRLVRDRGVEAFRPIDEDKSVMEYARAGQLLCKLLMGDDDPQALTVTTRRH